MITFFKNPCPPLFSMLQNNHFHCYMIPPGFENAYHCPSNKRNVLFFFWNPHLEISVKLCLPGSWNSFSQKSIHILKVKQVKLKGHLITSKPVSFRISLSQPKHDSDLPRVWLFSVKLWNLSSNICSLILFMFCHHILFPSFFFSTLTTKSANPTFII